MSFSGFWGMTFMLSFLFLRGFQKGKLSNPLIFKYKMGEYKLGDLCSVISQSCGKSPAENADYSRSQRKKKKRKDPVDDSFVEAHNHEDNFETEQSNNETTTNSSKETLTHSETPSKKKRKKHKSHAQESPEKDVPNDSNVAKSNHKKSQNKSPKSNFSNENVEYDAINMLVKSLRTKKETKISENLGNLSEQQQPLSESPHNNKKKRKACESQAINDIKKKFNNSTSETLEKRIKTTHILSEGKNELDNSRNNYLLEKQKKMERINKRKDNTPLAKDPEAEKRTIYVGNVSVTTNRKVISKFFSKYGQVETVRIRGVGVQEVGMSKKEAITLKKFHPSRQTVVAYVRFKDVDSVDKAVAANGQVIDGLHIRVDSALGNSKTDSHSVFIGNLSFEIQEEELWDKFSDCGNITNVRVVRSTTTGAGKGFAFVSFESRDGIELALEKDGDFLLGRDMRISRTFKKAKPKDHNRNMPASQNKKTSLSFLKQDKPKQLQNKQDSRESHNRKKQMMKNFSGSKVIKDDSSKKLKKRKPRLSKDAKRKNYIAKVLSGPS